MGRKEKTDGEERRRKSEEIFKRSPEGEDHISSEENLPARGSPYRVSICTALMKDYIIFAVGNLDVRLARRSAAV